MGGRLKKTLIDCLLPKHQHHYHKYVLKQTPKNAPAACLDKTANKTWPLFTVGVHHPRRPPVVATRDLDPGLRQTLAAITTFQWTNPASFPRGHDPSITMCVPFPDFNTCALHIFQRRLHPDLPIPCPSQTSLISSAYRPYDGLGDLLITHKTPISMPKCQVLFKFCAELYSDFKFLGLVSPQLLPPAHVIYSRLGRGNSRVALAFTLTSKLKTHQRRRADIEHNFIGNVVYKYAILFSLLGMACLGMQATLTGAY